jgi:hypothetical protein
VAEQFTGAPGVFVKREDTVRSFKEILEGKHDRLPEQAFYMVGTIEDAVKRAQFAEIRNNVLSLICEEGERAEEIDLEAAIAAEKVAREKIAAMTRVDPTLPKAETALRVALLRQAIVRRRSGTGHI